eukprot:6203846-Pleurochrysis_carterae.AAC.1
MMLLRRRPRRTSAAPAPLSLQASRYPSKRTSGFVRLDDRVRSACLRLDVGRQGEVGVHGVGEEREPALCLCDDAVHVRADGRLQPRAAAGQHAQVGREQTGHEAVAHQRRANLGALHVARAELRLRKRADRVALRRTPSRLQTYACNMARLGAEGS